MAPKASPAAGTPAASPSPKAPVVAPASPIAKIEYDEDDSADDGPTLAQDGFAELQQAAASYPLSDAPPRPAAGAAPLVQSASMPEPSPVSPVGGVLPSQRSPMSATGFTPGPSAHAANAKAAAPDVDAPEGENEAATVTVPKDVLDRVRANPKAFLEESKAKAPPPAAGRPYDDADDAAEPTKAVSREELLRGATQDGHVVIGADAGGEDATLAVAPGEVGMNLNAAIGETLKSAGSPLGNEGGFPPPSNQFQGTQQMPQGMGPMGGHPGAMPPQQQDWSQAPAPPGMGMPGQHGQQGHWSSGHMPAAIPRTQGGVQSYPGGPMMQQPPQQGAFPRGQAPTNWNPLQAPPQKSKISGQMILLIVVGFVCLAIFVTGIVLFATTKF